MVYLKGAAETGCLTGSTAVGPSQLFSSTQVSFSMTESDAEQTVSNRKQFWGGNKDDSIHNLVGADMDVPNLSLFVWFLWNEESSILAYVETENISKSLRRTNTVSFMLGKIRKLT